MLETSDLIEQVYPAATVVLIRDCVDGIEVLLVQRSKAVQHMGGMWVFPGGKVEQADYPSNRDDYQAAVNAAIRETEEEAGLRITAEQLMYLSHWTTPEGAKKRFATWFFLAILGDGQEVQVDGGEIALHRWLTPKVALAASADSEHPLRLMPPTFVSLSDIADCKTAVEVTKKVCGRDAIVYEPRVALLDDGICFLYAGDAGHHNSNLNTKGPRHRLYMVNDQLKYIREC